MNKAPTELGPHFAAGPRVMFASPVRIIRSIVVAALCAVLAGCVTSDPNLDPSYQPGQEDAVIVLVVEGADMVGITPGRSDGKIWRFVAGLKNRPVVAPRDGFVVVRLDPTTPPWRYGIYTVILGGSSTNAMCIAAQFGKQVATFEADAGTVTYVGTLDFQKFETPASVQMRTMWNPGGAREHMIKYYPALVNRLRCKNGLEFREDRLERYW